MWSDTFELKKKMIGMDRYEGRIAAFSWGGEFAFTKVGTILYVLKGILSKQNAATNTDKAATSVCFTKTK